MPKVPYVWVPSLILAIFLPSLAVAEDEWEFALSGFGGRNIVESADVGRTRDDTGLDAVVTDVLLTNSSSFGGRFTAWWVRVGHVPPEIGFAIEATTFSSDLPVQTASGPGTLNGSPVILTLSFLDPINLRSQAAALNLMFRYPIGVTAEFPHARWYPYVGVGAGVERTRANFAGAKDTDVAPLIQGLVGLNIFLTRRVSIFSEFKRTHATHDFKFAGVTGKFEIPLDVNHFVAGVAYHF